MDMRTSMNMEERGRDGDAACGEHQRPQSAKMLVCCGEIWIHICKKRQTRAPLLPLSCHDAPLISTELMWRHLWLRGSVGTWRLRLPSFRRLLFPGSANKPPGCFVLNVQGAWLEVQSEAGSQRATRSSCRRKQRGESRQGAPPAWTRMC